MSRKENILNAWIMVEHLTEGNINIRDKSIKSFDGKQIFIVCLLKKYRKENSIKIKKMQE